jgi:hypothetical protein
MASFEQIRRVRDLHESDLLALPNVVGVATGQRRVAGTRTEELAIVVYVKEKVPSDRLTRGQAIPRSFRLQLDGNEVEVRTDVVQTGEIVPTSDRQPGGTPPYNGKRQPMQPGYSIGYSDTSFDYVGTPGVLVVRDADKKGYILSNTHVLVDRNKNSVPIRQPSGVDGGLATDRIGQTALFVALDSAKTNYMDAAIASIDDYSKVDPMYPVLGSLRGHLDSVGAQWHFRKVGRTTGLTEGRAGDLDATISVNYSFGTFKFEKQVEVYTWQSPTISEPGDSGSVWVGDDNRPGLLLFAGSTPPNQHCWATPIAWVMSTFGLKVWSNGLLETASDTRDEGSYGGGEESMAPIDISKSRLRKP